MGEARYTVGDIVAVHTSSGGGSHGQHWARGVAGDRAWHPLITRDPASGNQTYQREKLSASPRVLRTGVQGAINLTERMRAEQGGAHARSI